MNTRRKAEKFRYFSHFQTYDRVDVIANGSQGGEVGIRDETLHVKAARYDMLFPIGKRAYLRLEKEPANPRNSPRDAPA
jgi:hypothetical protein